MVRASWEEQHINDRRLEVMKSCRQTKPSTGFSLIIDDSGHRKSAPPALRFPQRKDGARSGNFTDGVGRQYIGEIGQTDNGIVVVTSHLYDGVKSLPLDIELYQHANSLPFGKFDQNFLEKPEIALNLIDRTLKRKYRPGIVIIDSGYGNNTSFLKELENRKLNYLGGIAKNRKVLIKKEDTITSMRMDKLAESLPKEAFTEVELNLDKPKKVWVKTLKVEISRLKGIRSVAIVGDAATFEEATDIDYFITNIDQNIVTPQWVVETYSQRNWVEVFYREAKGWLGLKEYQVRHKRSLLRHFILVFCAYTFILWHKLTGGLRRRWGNKPLKTFPEASACISYSYILSFLQLVKE